MKVWLHTVRCWFDDRAHMFLNTFGVITEGLDLTGMAGPIKDLFPKYGQQIYSGAVFVIFAMGIWRSKITHARGQAMKVEIQELKQAAP